MVVTFLLLVVFATAIHARLGKKNKHEIFPLFVRYACLILIGLSGVFAFTGHIFMSGEIARRIGWLPGNPFQLEVGVANLAFGILGILAFRFAAGFRIATVLGWFVFLTGSGFIHLREMFVAGNNAPLNAGLSILAADLIIPVVLLVFVLFAEKKSVQNQ